MKCVFHATNIILLGILKSRKYPREEAIMTTFVKNLGWVRCFMTSLPRRFVAHICKLPFVVLSLVFGSLFSPAFLPGSLD